MKVQSISSNYNFNNANSLNNSKNQNNPQIKYNPSFQQLRFSDISNWDKEILDKVVNNEEIKKLVSYLEGKNSVLEMHIHHDSDLKHNPLYGISCTYDRHKVVWGEDAEIIHPDKKENVIDKLKRFSATKFIEMIERKETAAGKKFVELEHDFFIKEEAIKEDLKKKEVVVHNFFSHIVNFFKH